MPLTEVLTIVGFLFAATAILRAFIQDGDFDRHRKLNVLYALAWRRLKRSGARKIYQIMVSSISRVINHAMLKIESLADYTRRSTSNNRLGKFAWVLLSQLACSSYSIQFAVIEYSVSKQAILSIVLISISLFILTLIFMFARFSSRDEIVAPTLFVYSVAIFGCFAIYMNVFPRLSFVQMAIFLLVGAPWFVFGFANVSLVLSTIMLRGMTLTAFLRSVSIGGNQAKPITMSIVTFGYAFPLLVLLTYGSFFVGSRVSPNSPIPEAFQFIIINGICDSLSIVFTYTLSVWVLRNGELKFFPLFVIIDMVAAASLALVSGYAGLLGSEYSITVQEAAMIVIGKSAENPGQFELGPIFWAMHTTFIPTLMLVFALVLAYILRLSIEISLVFFSRGHRAGKSVTFTLTSLAIFVGIAILGLWLSDLI